MRHIAAAVAVSSLSFTTSCASFQRPAPDPLTPEDRVVINAVRTPIRVLSIDSIGVAHAPGCMAKQVQGILQSVVADTVLLTQVTDISPSRPNDPACVLDGRARVELGPDFGARLTPARAGASPVVPLVVLSIMAVAVIVVIALKTAERRAVEILIGVP